MYFATAERVRVYKLGKQQFSINFDGLSENALHTHDIMLETRNVNYRSSIILI